MQIRATFDALAIAAPLPHNRVPYETLECKPDWLMKKIVKLAMVRGLDCEAMTFKACYHMRLKKRKDWESGSGGLIGPRSKEVHGSSEMGEWMDTRSYHHVLASLA